MKWIDFKDKQPEIGQEVDVKFIRHRQGLIESKGQGKGKFIGMNTVINMPMVHLNGEDHEDDFYIEFTKWKPR